MIFKLVLRGFILILFVLLYSCGFNQNAEMDDKPNIPSGIVMEDGVLRNFRLHGTAINTTYDLMGEIRMEIRELSPGKFECLGKFGEKKLFGRFKMRGESVKDDVKDKLNLSFSGTIRFGNNDGSNFADNTNADFDMSLEINGETAKGKYQVGEIYINYFSRKQVQQGVINNLIISAL